MGYIDEKKRIFDYVTDDGKIIELNGNNLKSYDKVLRTYSDSTQLGIKYPGYKTSARRCDYCVYLRDDGGEHPISHVEIMKDLYNKTSMQNYPYMKRYIEEVATIGREVNMPASLFHTFERGYSFEKLTDLMFYIAIQEDINYPDAKYQGRKMCFYRYLEAVYCKVNDNHKIEEAIAKANAHGYIPRNWYDVGELYSNVSKIVR